MEYVWEEVEGKITAFHLNTGFQGKAIYSGALEWNMFSALPFIIDFYLGVEELDRFG